MGDFDDQIAWLRERRKIAYEDLADYRGGQRFFRNDVDITGKLAARAEEDIRRFDILIAAYEDHNATRP